MILFPLKFDLHVHVSAPAVVEVLHNMLMFIDERRAVHDYHSPQTADAVFCESFTCLQQTASAACQH